MVPSKTELSLYLAGLAVVWLVFIQSINHSSPPSMRGEAGLTDICNQIDRFTPQLSDMICTIYGLKYLWSIKLMFCESYTSARARGLDLTCRVESVSHSNCVAIQKDHVLFGAL